MRDAIKAARKKGRLGSLTFNSRVLDSSLLKGPESLRGCIPSVSHGSPAERISADESLWMEEEERRRVRDDIRRETTRR